MGLDPASATSAAAASLAPGFRFHPTDEELVSYYLKRKVCRKPFRFDAISEIDVYKSEPWDLPDMSRLKSRDLEWYFFSVLDKKYGNGSRTNRATERGYWKTTGKDRPVHHKLRMVGMKKTLVYHSGRAPRGERTNWVMHEYRLVDEELEKSGIVQDAFVLCRIFRKSGSGPKNGEQYGAPFVEEEWDNDELVMVPGEEADVVADDPYLDANDLKQIFGADILSEDAPLPFSFCYGDNTTNFEELEDFVDDAQKLLPCAGESYNGPEQPDNQNFLSLPVHHMDGIPVKDEYVGESSDTVNYVDEDYLLDEPFFDATGNIPFDDREFLETDDLSNPIEANPSGFDMLEEYLTFFDADGDIPQYMAFDSSKMMVGSENLVSEQASLTQKLVNGGAQVETMGSQQLFQGHDNYVASTSKQEPGNSGLDIQHPFIKQASRMLSNIPAPSAFASEFPTKDAALRLNSTSHSSNPVHVTAGMIQTRNMTLGGDGRYWLPGKQDYFNIILSFGLSPDDANSASYESTPSVLSGKAGSGMLRCWFYLLFIWVLILSVSCKIGTCFYTRRAA